MDHLTPQQRHKNMAAIRSKDTKSEMIVRKWLWSHGYRYRLNVKSVPGKPDIVMRRFRTAIFVNGCFWHGHNVALPQIDNGELIIDNSKCCKIPKTNREFWVKKISGIWSGTKRTTAFCKRMDGTALWYGNVS